MTVLATIIVLLLWFDLTAMSILVGAEVDAEVRGPDVAEPSNA